MDGAGVLFDDAAIRLTSRADRRRPGRPRLQDAIVESQDAALDRLRARDFGARSSVSWIGLLTAPRKPAPQVAWDFWDQFKLAEERSKSCGSTARPFTARCPEDPERAWHAEGPRTR